MSRGERVAYVCAAAGIVLLLLTGGYIVQSCRSWFGNIFISENRVSTDASVFVSEYFPSDFDAVNYLNMEVTGQPVVLEAPGDSYSNYERISVATGLPTVAGWHTHEWLWRGDTAELDQRIADVETIYTSADAAAVRALAEKYNISYIYVGNLEREKYPALNDAVLRSLGEIAFDDGAGTYIVRIAR